MNVKTLSVAILTFVCCNVTAQDIFGKWKTFSRHSGEVRSIMEVYEKNNKVYGKVLRIIKEENRNSICSQCKGLDKDKKIEGLVVMKDFEKDGSAYINGTILNPSNGKTYSSKMWLDKENVDLLKIRGYVGFLYKTVEWQRVR